MARTPGIMLPTAYSSVEEFDKELQRRSEEAGFTELMHSSESVDEVLEHFGVKGMRWGVRRREGADGTVGGRFHSPHAEPSHDAARAKDLSTRARKGGTSTLSNQELKALTERMNLEQQYSRLSGDKSNVAKARKGLSAAREILNVGKTASEAYTLINSPMAKEIGKALAKKG